jgi:hypothetical protein
MVVREARLRPEYAGWYPGLVAGVWHSAAWLYEVMLQLERGAPRVWKGRILSNDRFEFQGEVSPRATLSCRLSDAANRQPRFGIRGH